MLISTFRQGDRCRSRAFTRIGGEAALLRTIYVKLGFLLSVSHVMVRGLRASDGVEIAERVEG